MKTSFTRKVASAGLVLLLGLAAVQAGDYTWDVAGGTGIDDGAGSWGTVGTATAQQRWRLNSTAAAVSWPNGTADNAIIGGGTAGAAGVISVASGQTCNVGNITFNAANGGGSYTVAAGASASARLSFSSGSTVTVANGVAANLNCPFIGTGFTKAGAGSLTVSPGNTLNGYTGPITVNAGTLTYQGSRQVIGAGGIKVNGGTLALATSTEMIDDTASITNAGGTIDMQAVETVASLVLESGTMTNTITSGNRTLTCTSAINLQSGTINATEGGGRSFRIDGTIGMTKTGPGTVDLGPAFTGLWSGKSTVSGGVLHISADNGLGLNPASFVADQLTLNGGTIRMTNTFSWGGNRGTTLGASGGTIDVDTGVTLTWSSTAIISGTSGGGLTKIGAGTIAMNQPNTYDGATTISNGVLQITSTALFGSGPLNLSGGTLSLTSSRDVTTAPLSNVLNLTANSVIQCTPSSASTVELNITSNSINTTAGSLTFSNLNSSTGLFQPRFSGTGFNFSRPITVANGPTANTVLMSANSTGTQTFSGGISGGGGFRRLTAGGTTILSGVNTYSGATTVTAGTLLVHGQITASTATVASGAVLGGNGKISTVSMSAGGTLAPGASVGVLTVTNLTLNATSTNVFEFDVTGGTNDTLVVQGDLNPAGSIIQINVTSGTLGTGTNTIITYTGTKTGSFSTAVVLGAGTVNGALSLDESTPGVIKLVVLPPPVALNFVQQPTTTTAGTAITPAVTVLATNASGGAVAGVSVTLSLASGTGTLQGTLTQSTDGSGLATFANLTNTTAGTKQLRAVNAANLLTNDSSTFDIVSAAASKLAFVSNPGNTTAGVTVSPSVTVQLQDVYGNSVANAGTNVALTLNGGGTLNGTTTQATDGSGLATFGDLSINQAGLNKTLSAAASPLTAANSTSFNITAAAADHLIFSQAITSPQLSGANFIPAPVLTVADAFGNVISNSTASITAALTSTDGATPGALAGGVTVSANGTSGSATFSTLKFNLGDPAAAENIVVDFSSAGLISATNASINVGPAVALSFQQQPTDVTAGANISPNVTVLVTNANTGTPLAGIAVTISKVAGSGTLEGTLTQLSDGSGLATFTNLVIKAAGTGKQLRATHSTITTDSSTFAVNAGTFTKLQVLAAGETNAPGASPGKGGTITGQHVGTAFNITVNAVDAYWNLVNTATDTIHVTTSDAGDTEPADAALVAGTKAFSLTPATVGTLTATVTDVSNGGITQDTSSNIPVYHANPFFRSKAVDGNWTNNPASAIWQSSTDDGLTWADATEFPTNNNSDAIFITNNARINVNSAIPVDDVVIYAGATNRLQTGAVLTISHRPGATVDYDVYGQMNFSANQPITQNSGAVVQFENGGSYVWTSTGAAAIPKSTWVAGSTCMIAPSGTGGATPSAASLQQAFHHFTWIWPNMTSSVNLAGLLTNVGGDLTVSAGTTPGSTAFKLYNAEGSFTNMTIGGNLIVQSGFLCTIGSSSNNSAINITVGGSIIVSNGAALDIRDSGLLGACNFTLTGASAVYANANPAVGAGITNSGGNPNGRFNWTIAPGATLTLQNDLPLFNTGVLNVQSNGTLICAGGSVTTNMVNLGAVGGNTFTLADGGALRIGSTAGITATGNTGNIRVDTRNFGTNADYIYTGTSAQVLGSGLPATVRNLTLATGMTNSVTVSNTVAKATPSYNVSGTLTANSAVTAYSVAGSTLRRGSYSLFTYGTLSGSLAATPVLVSGSVGSAPTVTGGNLVVPNTAPVGVADSFNRSSGTSYKVKKADLVANDTDVDLDTLSVSAVAATTTNGATLTSDATYIYVPANTVADAFTYTVSDGFGGSSTGTVTLALAAGTGQTTGSITLTGGDAVLTFFGISGNSYTIQRSGDLSTWTDVTTVTAGSTGVITYTDVAPTPPVYYRLKAN